LNAFGAYATAYALTGEALPIIPYKSGDRGDVLLLALRYAMAMVWCDHGDFAAGYSWLRVGLKVAKMVKLRLVGYNLPTIALDANRNRKAWKNQISWIWYVLGGYTLSCHYMPRLFSLQ
jgi:hypothetical protein